MPIVAGLLDRFLRAPPIPIVRTPDVRVAATTLLGWCALQRGYTDPDRVTVQSAARTALARLAALSRDMPWRREVLRRAMLTEWIDLASLMKESGEELLSSGDRNQLQGLLSRGLSQYNKNRRAILMLRSMRTTPTHIIGTGNVVNSGIVRPVSPYKSVF